LASIYDHARRRELTEGAVYYIIKVTAARAGVNPAASVHWLRRAHASHPTDNGEPIETGHLRIGAHPCGAPRHRYDNCSAYIQSAPVQSRGSA
jgi:hypothetical protein